VKTAREILEEMIGGVLAGTEDEGFYVKENIDYALKELRKILIGEIGKNYSATIDDPHGVSATWNTAVDKCLEVVNNVFKKD